MSDNEDMLQNIELKVHSHNCPKVDKDALEEVNEFAKELMVECEGEKMGWEKGRVVLVSTDKPIEQWIPIAVRVL